MKNDVNLKETWLDRCAARLTRRDTALAVATELYFWASSARENAMLSNPEKCADEEVTQWVGN